MLSMAERYDYEDAEVQAPVKPARVGRAVETRVESPAVLPVPSAEKNPVMAEMGKSGGQARAVSLSAERRREIARLGGLARARGK